MTATIIHDADYLRDPRDVELLPGAAAAIAHLNTQGLPVIVVTNEVGLGVVPATPLGREYRDLEPPRTGIFNGLRIVIDPDVADGRIDLDAMAAMLTERRPVLVKDLIWFHSMRPQRGCVLRETSR